MGLAVQLNLRMMSPCDTTDSAPTQDTLRLRLTALTSSPTVGEPRAGGARRPPPPRPAPPNAPHQPRQWLHTSLTATKMALKTTTEQEQRPMHIITVVNHNTKNMKKK